jgi:hypothetical protein
MAFASDAASVTSTAAHAGSGKPGNGERR